MTVTCPNGHPSATADYCDQCGVRIAEGQAAAPLDVESPAAESEPAAGPSAQAPQAMQCPLCSAPRVGDDRFCEQCGYDFVSGAPASQGQTSGRAWELVVTADRDYYQRLEPEGVQLPADCPARTFLLTGTEVQVGRRSVSRGIRPEIDLSGPPEDPGISHLHALLKRQPDGSYAVVDPGSTNGTTLNDNPDPIATNVAVPLSDGDRIHLGAWTTMTLHACAD
jgi:hypothetical protein